MAVQKFKSLKEAEQALWTLNPDNSYYNNVRAFYKLFSRLSSFSYPKGIHKFRNLEEAEQHKLNAIVSAASISKTSSKIEF